MLPEVLYKGITLIIKYIFHIVKSMFPAITLGVEFSRCLSVILTCCSQANNFLHFILGDLCYVLVTFSIVLIIYQYVAYPIINFVIGIFENKA